MIPKRPMDRSQRRQGHVLEQAWRVFKVETREYRCAATATTHDRLPSLGSFGNYFIMPLSHLSSLICHLPPIPIPIPIHHPRPSTVHSPVHVHTQTPFPESAKALASSHRPMFLSSHVPRKQENRKQENNLIRRPNKASRYWSFRWRSPRASDTPLKSTQDESPRAKRLVRGFRALKEFGKSRDGN